MNFCISPQGVFGGNNSMHATNDGNHSVEEEEDPTLDLQHKMTNLDVVGDRRSHHTNSSIIKEVDLDTCATNATTRSGEPKRRIRFAREEAKVLGRVPNREDLTAEEKNDTWWSGTEYQGIRLKAKFLTKDVRRERKALIAGIEEAYARALHLACTLSDEDYEDLMKDCEGQVFCMKSWCAELNSPRGLERYTSRKHRVERIEFAEETRAAVLRLAANDNVTSEQLAMFYKEYARSSVIYARFCGEADHMVSEAARPIVEDENGLPPVPRINSNFSPKRGDHSAGRKVVRQISESQKRGAMAA